MLKSELVAPLTIGSTKRISWIALLKSDWAVSGVLVLVCAIPALALWRHSNYLTGDSYQYLRAAQTFAAGQGLRDMSGEPFTVLTPLYPLLIGAVHRLFANVDIETIARLVSFAGAAAAVVGLYWLLRVRYSLWISFSGALMFALLPLRVWSSFWVLSEGLYVGLLILALAVLFRSRKRLWVAGAGGLLFGLAYLTRPEAILCFAGAVALSAMQSRDGRKRALAIVAGFLLVAVPYHAWVYRMTGNPSSGRLRILLAQSQAIYEGNMSKMLVFNQASADGALTQSLRSEMTPTAVGKRYLFFARTEIQRLLYLLGPHLLVIVLLLVGALLSLSGNIVRMVRGLQFADAWPFLLASWLLLLPFLHVEDRYLLQVMPAFLLWLILIAVAVQKLAAAKLRGRSKLVAPLIPLAFMSVFLLSYGYRLTTQIPQGDSSALARGTARWLDSQKLSAPTILSQTPDLAFFSNGKHLWMPSGEPDHVLKYARRSGASYVYISSRDVRTPLNNILLGDVTVVPASFHLLHEESDGSVTARLFSVSAN